MEEIHLAVDTQIVIIGVSLDHEQHLPCHESILKEIETRVFLALDGESLSRKGHVLVEYEKQMPTGSNGRRWLANMAIKDRLRFYKKLRPLPHQLRVTLNLQKDDHKWVRLALATPTKRIVSEDGHFSEKVCRELAAKPHKVTVHTAQKACEWISANLETDTPV